jgi:aminoglycoside 3-N-acetyltransferase
MPQILRSTLTRLLNDRQKRALKTKINETRNRLIKTLLRYDAARLKQHLREFGIAEDDTLLVHANFKPDSGFPGSPLDLANALTELVGERGNLLMVSIPFRGSAYDYLQQGKPFNVKKTISMMGLVTETFRRREGTLRSLHPTHPVLAFGKDAEAIVAGHESCLYACGPGSPFEKFRSLKGKILFFDVGFESITFFHHVEDLLKDRLPFPVYDERLFSAPVIDAAGTQCTVESYAFSRNVRRRADKLEAEMRARGLLRQGRIGNSRFIMVSAEDVVAVQTAMVAAGNYPYDWNAR